jgi:toxin ParE1/3/4
MARVLRRPRAAEDIAAVWDFIADDNPDAADHWVDQLDTQLRLLATQPLMGRARDELAPGIRSFPFGRYLVFYLPIGDGIDVVRVLHGTRDVDTAFGEDNP